mmetsp:Transcript_13033/g.24151  ORF Transcript_13033/g.24151 Transcript_13033/m.24151 type:complete len:128 (-) Transcript_13033:747-1130(-)
MRSFASSLTRSQALSSKLHCPRQILSQIAASVPFPYGSEVRTGSNTVFCVSDALFYFHKVPNARKKQLTKWMICYKDDKKNHTERPRVHLFSVLRATWTSPEVYLGSRVCPSTAHSFHSLFVVIQDL